MAGLTRTDNDPSGSAWDSVTHTGAGVSLDSAGTVGFVPEVWSGKLIEKFYSSTVLSAISNTDYEGEIKGYGDNIVIRTVPSITISDYEIGSKLSYQLPASALVDMPIDKGKYFAFQIDDVDKYQSDLNLIDAWSKDAAEQMKVAIDTQVLAAVYSGAAAENAGATAGKVSSSVDLGTTGTNSASCLQISKTTVLEAILNHGQALDEYNCPEEGRYIVLPAWAIQMLKLSDIKDASLAGDGTSVLRNGRVGMVDRFEVYSSNLLATTTENTSYTHYHVIAGHKKALAFAAQMTKMETLPNPDTFGQLIRGLNVYGFKVVDGTLLTHGRWFKNLDATSV